MKDSDEVRPTITPEPTDTPDPDDEVDHATPEQKAQEVFKLVNTERMKAGLQPYKYDLRLEKAAMVRAKEIAVKFSHERPDGTSSEQLLRKLEPEVLLMRISEWVHQVQQRL